MYSDISTVEKGHIFVRGIDLVDDLMGKVSFTEMIGLTVMGRLPDDSEERLLNAVLVSLVDHGATPSSLAARLTYGAAPEALQGAVAAGLLNSGGRVLGAMEGCGKLLSEWAPEQTTDEAIVKAASALVADRREKGERIPGLGHAFYEEGDSRASRLFAIAEEEGHRGRYVRLLEQVADEFASATGNQLLINITGGIAAVLLEIGVEQKALRGFGLMSRVVGLVAHIAEEEETGAVRSLMHRIQRGEL